MYNFIPIPKDVFSIYRIVSDPSDWRYGTEYTSLEQATTEYKSQQTTHYLFEIVYPLCAKQDEDVPPCAVFVFINSEKLEEKIRVI